MSLSNEQIDQALARYEREWDRFQKLVDFVADAARGMILENAIPATVQARAKDPARLRGKLVRKRDELDSVEAVFLQLKDFAAVRVATYVESDRERVVTEIQQRFVGPDGGDVVSEVRDFDLPSFYRATHCQVKLAPDDLVGRNENLAETTCEIQVCSLLAHVWNELEHDLAYKPQTGDLSTAEQESLINLGHLVRAGDGLIRTLLEATDRRLTHIQGPFLDQWDFVARMRDRFPEATAFGAHSGQLFAELRESGLTTPQDVEQRLLGDDAAEAVRRGNEMLEQLKSELDSRDDDVVQLDARTSDVLLMLYLEQHAADVLDRHPAGRGRGRPPRISSAARRFRDLLPRDPEA